MKSLLYLSHRIPFPPNKGDKIRSYNLLARLAKNYRVYLATFIDDKNDWQYTDVLREICEDCLFVGLNPLFSRALSARGLITGSSLTLPYYSNREMDSWVRELVRDNKLDAAVAFSSSMAQYLEPLHAASLPSVIDFCDVDSDKWLQYSENKGFPMRWVYAREGGKLAAEENQFHLESAASVFISDDECDVFRDIATADAEKICTVKNGVDTDFFDPDAELDNPFSDGEKAIVFVGAMDYWPNIDAVSWFAQDIFPAISRLHPDLRFYIVGSSPTDAVMKLEQDPNIKVTGRVDDVRAYLQYAHCCVAPIRVARGVQNKVLEAMSMAKRTVASAAAIEGIGSVDDLVPVESIEDWVEAISAALKSEKPERKDVYRQHVMDAFSWDASGAQLSALVENAISR